MVKNTAFYCPPFSSYSSFFLWTTFDGKTIFSVHTVQTFFSTTTPECEVLITGSVFGHVPLMKGFFAWSRLLHLRIPILFLPQDREQKVVWKLALFSSSAKCYLLLLYTGLSLPPLLYIQINIEYYSGDSKYVYLSWMRFKSQHTKKRFYGLLLVINFFVGFVFRVSINMSLTSIIKNCYYRWAKKIQQTNSSRDWWLYLERTVVKRPQSNVCHQKKEGIDQMKVWDMSHFLAHFTGCFAWNIQSIKHRRRVSYYSPDHLFGSLQNTSAPVGFIEKLRSLYYVHRPFCF